MEQGEDLKRRYWFVMDELAALNRLPWRFILPVLENTAAAYLRLPRALSSFIQNTEEMRVT